MNGSKRIRLIRARAKSDAEQSESVAAKAVGYIRVSTEEQAVNGHGLEVQERAIRAFADSQGYELPRGDRGSGYFRRPGALLRDRASGES